MGEFIISTSVLTGVIVVTSSFFILKYITKKNKISVIERQKASEENNKKLISEEIEKKLEEMEKEYFSQALSYYIYILSNENHLDFKSKEQLEKEFGKKLTFPVIEWVKNFEYLYSDLYLVDGVIENYLIKNNFVENKESRPINRFDKYINSKAKSKAKEIIDDYLNK